MGNSVCCKAADLSVGWKQQSKQQAANTVYQFMNLQKSGKLVDVFLSDQGVAGVERLIREELDHYMYRSGKGKVVRKIDYVKYRRKATADAMGEAVIDTRTDKQILSQHVDDHFIKFEDHEACWDINLRGAVGETAFHLCILGDTPVLNEITKILLSHYPKLALDIYEGPEYYGESSLHIAIVNGDFEMVRLLVENGANVNQRATGCFFLPEDQKKRMTKSTNYKGYAYYGEYPLAFAACFGREAIYDYLIDHGSDPNLQDLFGNTVLHMIVVSNQIGMYNYAVKHHAKKANVEMKNNAKLTPLTLASKLGCKEIFQEIIEQQSVEIWRYSNIICATYPLNPVDTIGPQGKINRSSALIYLTDGGTDRHLEMLTEGVINQLLNEKWKTFARRRFFQRLLLASLHLFILSVAIYARPVKVIPGLWDARTICRYIAEIIVCCNCVINLFFQLEEIRSQGLSAFVKGQMNAPAKFLFNISCVIILMCIPVRAVGNEGVEMILLALAAPCAWAFLLFFARGAFLLGPFVIMIYEMCASDMFRFVIIFMIFLIQFSQGFYFLFKDIDNQNVQFFRSPGGTIMQLFQMTLGEFKYDDFDQTRMPILTKIMFGLFAVFVPILLLNMLIAMMGNTYQLISSRAEKEWHRQWAKIIIVLERSFSPKHLLRFRLEYSVAMGDGKERGLMVISTTGKTKARQRKGAIANWKRVANEIKDLIKETTPDGKGDGLDLTSDNVTEKVAQNRRKQLTETGTSDETGGVTCDGLLSAMTQLAWERDIDLGAGKMCPPAGSGGKLPRPASGGADRSPMEQLDVVNLDKPKEKTDAKNDSEVNREERLPGGGGGQGGGEGGGVGGGEQKDGSKQQRKKRRRKRRTATSNPEDEPADMTSTSSLVSLLKAWDTNEETTL